MTRQALYVLLVVFVTSLALAICNVLYTNHVDAQAEQRNQARAREFCEVVRLIDDRYQKLPPTADPEAQKFAEVMHRYRLRLGC
jgi:hypothetical protein